MSFRGDPETLSERVAFISEEIRKLQRYFINLAEFTAPLDHKHFPSGEDGDVLKVNLKEPSGVSWTSPFLLKIKWGL